LIPSNCGKGEKWNCSAGVCESVGNKSLSGEEIMKKGIRYARLSASIVAVLYGAAAHAQSVTWDPTGSDVNPPVDGSGNWDLTDSTWYNSGTAMDVQWSNAVPYSAVFGDPTSAAASATGTSNFVTLTNSINVQDITLGTATNGATNGFYNIVDDGGSETLTLNGNLIKASAVGESLIELTNPLVLAAGDHVVAINDTPGPVPELSIDNPITGSGSITMNNAFNSSGYTQYGTLVLNVDSDYSGGTNIVDGAVTANTQGALGTGTCVISNQGALEFGGNGTIQASNMSVTTPIEITRNTYTGTNFSDYPDAIISSNTGNSANVVNINGPFVVDSTNAQIAANTSTIVINSNITQGPDVTNGMLTVDGDFAGYVTLNGDNSALTGGIQLIGGVELNVSSLANLGGPTATLIFNGSGTFHPVGGFISNFGSLNVNYSTFAGGIDVDPGTTFTISQNLGGVGNTTGSVGERGTGTLDLSGNDILGGTTYWDSGTVNVTGTLSLGSLHLRSPVVNITGSITTTSGYSSFGQDTTGTNGGPDMATVYLTGSGSLTTAPGNDFNLSDNANTSCTFYVENNATLNINGGFYMGKSPGGTATINQSGGTVTNLNGGGDAFSLGQSGGTGVYNMSGGALNIDGEIWVGNQAGGTGTFIQTAGTITTGGWFVVGRQGGVGTYTMSGGTLTDSQTEGGSNSYIGEQSASTSTMTVEGSAVASFATQFWVGENGNGVLNVGSPTDPVNASPSFTVNSWLAIGRAGGGTATGTLNLYDGTATQQGSNVLDIGGDGGTATGVVNVYGGTLNALNTWIGENSTDVGTLNMNGGKASLGNVELALGNTANGTINLNAGVLSGITFTAQNNGGTGTPKLFLNGGTLTTTPGNVNNNFVGAKVVSVVSAGGAIVNPNGGYINYNSALTHDSSLSGADGGLTVTGTGTLQLGTAGSHTPQNTYNGGTTVNSGTLIIATAGALPSGSNVANSASFVVGANSTAGNVSGTGTTTVSSGVTFTASNFTQGALVDNGFAQINGSGTIGTSNDLGAITGTGTMTIGTGSSNNTIHLATNSGQSTLGSLVISSGSDLDIGNNSLILHYSSPATDPIASIAAWIKNGFYDLAGPQITSSDIAADDAASGLSYGIGYADGADGVVGGLPSGEVEIMFTLLGDANLDGTVNAEDFTPFSAHLGQSGMWDAGDFNYDGTVNAEDFTPFSANLGQSATLAAGAGILESADGLSLANVPEPASVVGLLAVGGLCALRRRRRKV
jgi:fibronectin-binding autotransporter adhesin